MKHTYLLLVPALVLASCGGKDPGAKLAELRSERAKIDAEIKKLEGNKTDSAGRATPVSVMEMHAGAFNGYIEVQSQITGDEVVSAAPRQQGTINSVLVQVGQQVRKGQILATLDGTIAEQQMKTLEPQIELAKTMYEKTQKLWEQNIGTEVQLMQAKAQYDNLIKQKALAQSARDLYNIVSPINGVVDAVNMKVGDGSMFASIRVVNNSKLKAQASLGENYLGKVKEGDKALLIFPDLNDSLTAKVTYVAKAVDNMSRAFGVEIKLGDNKKLHPNMSCILRIQNYTNPNAMVVPVSIIQKTAEGDMIYVVEGNTARAVMVQTGRNANGKVEVLSGLKDGDKVVVAGFEDLDSGKTVVVQ
jgi:RND family efflux transporter MFP subunit